MNAPGPAESMGEAAVAASELEALFPLEDYRFHLTLRRGQPADFFRPRDPTGSVRAERARWLAETPTRYVACRPAGEAIAREFAAQAASWPGGAGAVSRWEELASALEADVLFLAVDADGEVRLHGGLLVFPTGWALEEKLGHTVEFIHGIVPGLNATLGAPIRQFLRQMKPGNGYLRDNWGLAASAERNLHPARGLPAPQPPVALDRLWLRVEHQILYALPETRGLVFGIRLGIYRLDTIARWPRVAAGLRRALASLPADLAAYKRIDRIRPDLLTMLERVSP